MATDLLVGFLGSLLISAWAFRMKWLSVSGMAAAVGVGTVLYGLGSLKWYVPLLFFFFSSSLLTGWRKKKKEEISKRYEKTGKRDAGQVLANGGLAALLCMGHAVIPHQAWWILYVGVMATVTADTWATEIGGRMGTRPVSIVTWKRVEPGTSGGISMTGLVGSLAGALAVTLVACLCAAMEKGTFSSVGEWTILLWSGTLAGFAGSFTDSLLGATIQATYVCNVCGRKVEAKIHCGQHSTKIRGYRWMTNDWVNFCSSVAGGGLAWLLTLP